QRALCACADARGCETVLADPREVEHEGLLVLEPHVLLDPVLEVRVETGTLRRTGKVVLPVRPPLQVDRTPRDLGLGPGDRLGVRHPGGRQRLVVVRPGLVVVVERGQLGVEEQRRQLAQATASPGPQLPALELPAALPAVLVLPLLRVADPRLCLDVVEPDVLRAAA